MFPILLTFPLSTHIYSTSFLFSFTSPSQVYLKIHQRRTNEKRERRKIGAGKPNMKPHQVLNFKVAFCTVFFICSALSQSINVNSKHAVHTNKKTHSNGLALLPDAELTIDQEEDDDGDSELEYSNEFDSGSSGSDTFGHADDFDRDNVLPFFHKVPENVYLMKNRQAILKCKATNALDVSDCIHLLNDRSPVAYQSNFPFNVTS